RRLQIAMDDPLVMCRFEGFTDTLRNVQSFIERDRAAAETFGQRLAFDKFQHEEARAVSFLEIIDARDIWGIERRDHLGFMLESLEAVRIGREFIRQDLDGDFALELRVARPVDLSHAAFTEKADDFMRTELSSDLYGHC